MSRRLDQAMVTTRGGKPVSLRGRGVAFGGVETPVSLVSSLRSDTQTNDAAMTVTVDESWIPGSLLLFMFVHYHRTATTADLDVVITPDPAVTLLGGGAVSEFGVRLYSRVLQEGDTSFTFSGTSELTANHFSLGAWMLDANPTLGTPDVTIIEDVGANLTTSPESPSLVFGAVNRRSLGSVSAGKEVELTGVRDEPDGSLPSSGNRYTPMRLRAADPSSLVEIVDTYNRQFIATVPYG